MTAQFNISPELLTKFMVTLELIQANIPIKKDVWVDEAKAIVLTGCSARKLFDLRKKQVIKWSSNEHGKDIKYSYQSIIKYNESNK